MLSAPEDPKIFRKLSCAGLITAKDMGYNFPVVTRVGKAGRDCDAFLINLLRCIIVVVCDLCGINLLIVSTSTGNAIKVSESTDLSFIANADIIIIIDAVVVFSSRGFQSRVLQSWIISIDIECTRPSKFVTYTGPITNDHVSVDAI